ncbi:MAG: response regulator [Spirochaetaceae bacterium]|nr:response regulator [Spirochaetaceae bacterium]
MNKIKHRILIVDDSMEQLDLLTEILIEKYEIISAFNGHQALKLAEREPKPDLILLDIIIPAPDGYEVCSILKSNESTRHIPVIMITGLSRENLKRGLPPGAAGYISKPYNVKQLNDMIANHLTREVRI